MPHLRLLAAGLGLLLAPVACARTVPPPVCAEAGVLDRLDGLLRQAGRPMRLLAETVGENSAGVDRIVHCAVRGQVLGYETNRYGMQPVNELLVVRYTLELRRNGIFIALQ